MDRSEVPDRVARIDLVVLIPESTRKHSGGSSAASETDAIESVLPDAQRKSLKSLRAEVAQRTPPGTIEIGKFLPAFRRFDGNMYRYIPPEAWETRSPAVEVLVASALRGLVASRDLIPKYRLSM